MKKLIYRCWTDFVPSIDKRSVLSTLSFWWYFWTDKGYLTLISKCDSVPLRTHVYTGDLGWFWLSCLGFFALLFPNMFNLFGFLMLCCWACLMKVIPEMRHAHLIIYIKVFIINYSYRAWTNNKGNNKITNSVQSYKGKVKTHKYINRQNQSTTGKLWKP